VQVQWYGQSAFGLEASNTAVAIDPFGDMSAIASRGLGFDYPPIRGLSAELLLITHEHADHNAVEVVGGEPVVLRSTAGRLQSPLGEVVAVASEHDEKAGTERGPNTIFVFELEGLRVCHFGDFGQSSLREAQAQAIGRPDLLFIPVGGGPTIGARQAADIAARLSARWVVPMHYRTERISFLETAQEFLALIGDVQELPSAVFDTQALRSGSSPSAVVPRSP
jgi:L-ascorbate metabolism protein UlaG (beta-lactamase superfamily)